MDNTYDSHQNSGDTIDAISGDSVSGRAAALLAERQAEVLNDWLESANSQISAAKHQGRAELADHFTQVLLTIIEELRHRDPLDTLYKLDGLESADSASIMHGRERATLKGYTADILAQEYILLRRTLVKLCNEHQVADAQVLEVITEVIEVASLNSIREFSLSMAEIQRKLVGTLVHDVRTPLSVAYTYAEILSLADMVAEKKKAAINTITRSLRRAVSMLEDMLDATRLDAGQGLFMRFTHSDLNEAMTIVVTEAAQVYSQRVTSSFENHPVTGVFDVGLVTRTVENLISNAVKFGDKDTPIEIELKDLGETVRISVHNCGEPIAKEDSETIFDFFSRPGSKPFSSHRGWGLGLSLIKVVAKSHGGEVIFQSTKKAGTTFGMILSKNYRKNGEELSMLLN